MGRILKVCWACCLLWACSAQEPTPLEPQPSPSLEPSPMAIDNVSHQESLADATELFSHPSSSLAPTSQPSPLVSIPKEEPYLEIVETLIVAGNGEKGLKDGKALNARFLSPTALCINPRNHNLYILDSHTVRKLNSEGEIETVAGKPEPGFKDGNNREALFNTPIACDFDEQGTLYIVDSLNKLIRKMDLQGQVSTLLGKGNSTQAESLDDLETSPVKDGFIEDATLLKPTDLTSIKNGNFYFIDGFRIRKVENNWVSTLNSNQKRQHIDAFKGINFNTVIGPLLNIHLGSLQSITQDRKGNLYITDDLKVIHKVIDEQRVELFDRFDSTSAEASQAVWGKPFKITFSDTRNGLFFMSDGNRLLYVDLDTLEIRILASQEHHIHQFTALNNAMISDGKDLIIYDSSTNQIKKLILSE